MGRKSPFDAAELCDFSGEYSGSAGDGAGWIDVLAEKGTAREAGEDLAEATEGYGWLVGRLGRGDALRF